MGVTTNYGFPYPDLNLPPHGPDQIKALADALDAYNKARRDRSIELMLSGDQTIFSTAVHAPFANGEMVAPITAPAGSWWSFQMFCLYSAPFAGDAKIALSGAGIQTAYAMPGAVAAPTGTIGTEDFGVRRIKPGDDGIPLTGGGIGTKLGAHIAGYVWVNTATVLGITWAQITSDPGATVMYAGTWAEFKRKI